MEKGLSEAIKRRAISRGVAARAAKIKDAERALLGKMTRRDLARKSGLHPSYVCRILKGERGKVEEGKRGGGVSVASLSSMAEALGLTIDVLYRRLLAVHKARETVRVRP